MDNKYRQMVRRLIQMTNDELIAAWRAGPEGTPSGVDPEDWEMELWGQIEHRELSVTRYQDLFPNPA